VIVTRLASIAFVFMAVVIESADPPSSLRTVATIPMPGVSGRIDHLAFDPATKRLFVAALGNNTVEVIDTAGNLHLRSLSGFHEPQGIAVVPDLKAVAIANGATGTLQLVEADSLKTRWTVPVGEDADNVRYDAARKQLLVAADGLAVVDPGSGQVVGRLDVGGHPESFQLESQSTRLYANVPAALQVIAADRAPLRVTGHWTVTAQANYPMALDEPGGRLFVGCRRPAHLVMLDTASGRAVGSTAIVGDTDDLFYDRTLQRLYVIGGEGFIDVVQRDGDTLQRIDRVATRDGARTGLWVPSESRLYLAVPARGGQPAEIRVFDRPN
jgi:YNCE-like beta-propeller